MSALKPLENRNVRGVASETYPTNKICAHPECTEPATNVHHCFPRSQIKSDSYFVEFLYAANKKAEDLYPTIDDALNLHGDAKTKTVRLSGGYEVYSVIIPHAVGLCGSGTTGHHGDAEEHRAWIKYEGGEFVWYERETRDDGSGDGPYESGWAKIGPLNPQPGSRSGPAKRPRFRGEAKRVRKTLTVRVPQDASEDGAGLLDDLVSQLEDELGHDPHRPTYFTLVDGLNFALMWVRDQGGGS